MDGLSNTSNRSININSNGNTIPADSSRRDEYQHLFDSTHQSYLKQPLSQPCGFPAMLMSSSDPQFTSTVMSYTLDTPMDLNKVGSSSMSSTSCSLLSGGSSGDTSESVSRMDQPIDNGVTTKSWTSSQDADVFMQTISSTELANDVISSFNSQRASLNPQNQSTQQFQHQQPQSQSTIGQSFAFLVEARGEGEGEGGSSYGGSRNGSISGSTGVNGAGSGNGTLSDTSGENGEDPAIKRAEQNRAAQRAFRQRKQQYIKWLESKAEELDEVYRIMALVRTENQQLRELVVDLYARINEDKKNSATSPSLSSPRNVNSTILQSASQGDASLGESGSPTRSPRIDLSLSREVSIRLLNLATLNGLGANGEKEGRDVVGRPKYQPRSSGDNKSGRVKGKAAFKLNQLKEQQQSQLMMFQNLQAI
ncbi:hypothetical protein BGZ99_004021, partial [Dissophora globulifera]